MRVSWQQNEGKLHFRLDLEDCDSKGPHRNPAGSRRLHTLGKDTFFIELPENLSVNSIHTDLIGLALISQFDMFIGSKLTLDAPVSRYFHEKCLQYSGIRVEPVSDLLKPRESNQDAVPAVAYSGGVDSSAALEVLPEEAKIFFLDRVGDAGSRYDKSAAYEACEVLASRGRFVYKVKSDIEHIISPPTFTNPLSPLFPIILLADHFEVDAIATGNILENVYGLLDNKYTENSNTRRLDELFKSLGLPLAHVMAGASEYVTFKILEGSDYKDIAQSCMYGRALGDPCKECIKCIRKGMLEQIVTNGTASSEKLNSLLSLEDVEILMRKNPINAQSVYMFLVSNTEDSGVLARSLRRKLMAGKHSTEWAKGWYSPSSKLIPEKYRQHVVEKILASVERCSPEQEAKIRKWNLLRKGSLLAAAFWHRIFWYYYSKQLAKNNLLILPSYLTVKVGQKVQLRAYLETGLFKKDITHEVKWTSSDSSKIKSQNNGEYVANGDGVTLVSARYKGSRGKVQAVVTE